MNKIKKFTHWVLINLKILKSEGVHSDGSYIVAGLYRWNPLSYIVAIIAMLIMAIVASVETVKDYWPTMWCENKK